MQDLRYAPRGALRQPGFTLTLLATLALGIGGTGGVFSVIDAVLVRTLPYAEPDRLVDLRPFEEDAQLLLTKFPREQVEPWLEEADFLILGIEMALRRGFVPEHITEDRRVVIPFGAYWREMGAAPGAIGTQRGVVGPPA